MARYEPLVERPTMRRLKRRGDLLKASERTRTKESMMPRLQYKRFGAAEALRLFPKGNADVVTVGEITVGRAVFESGWRWSSDLAPVMGTRRCQVHHLGHAVSGTLHVLMDDGAELDIPPDSIYEIPAGHDAWVVGDEPWVTLEWTSGAQAITPPHGPAERVLATVLFSDVANSTATLERLGDQAWQRVLQIHNSRVRGDLNAFRGREVKTTGDGFLAVFDGATNAVRCASAMVRSAEANGLAIRVGVHTGEVEFIDGDVRGLTVHAAARVMALAKPGEVLVSSTTRDLVEWPDLSLVDAGSHELRGLSGQRQLFRLA